MGRRTGVEGEPEAGVSVAVGVGGFVEGGGGGVGCEVRILRSESE